MATPNNFIDDVKQVQSNRLRRPAAPVRTPTPAPLSRPINATMNTSIPAPGIPGMPSPPPINPAAPTNPNQPAQPAIPTPVQGPQDPTGFGGMTGFGPGENLIGQQINLPTTTREELVQRMFSALTPQMDREAALRRESLGRSVAGLGRAGMGGVNTAFGTLEEAESRNRAELLGQLSASAAEGDINDIFRRGEFGARERDYQNQLDLQGQQSQNSLMQALQQLGFSFDPINNPNLTNALIGESDARNAQAAGTQRSYADAAGSVAGAIPFLI